MTARVRVEPAEVEVEEEITVVRIRRRYVTPAPSPAAGFVDALNDSASPLSRALAAYPRRLTNGGGK